MVGFIAKSFAAIQKEWKVLVQRSLNEIYSLNSTSNQHQAMAFPIFISNLHYYQHTPCLDKHFGGKRRGRKGRWKEREGREYP